MPPPISAPPTFTHSHLKSRIQPFHPQPHPPAVYILNQPHPPAVVILKQPLPPAVCRARSPSHPSHTYLQCVEQAAPPTPAPPTHLQCVEHDPAGSHRHPKPLHCIVERLHHVRRSLKYVWPHIIHEMEERVFTSKTKHTKRHVLHSPTGSLSMDQVPAGKGNRLVGWLPLKGSTEGEIPP